jgi:hypothetical protein
MLCVAAAALALLLPAASAEARVHVYARTKCVGLYCRIVTEPAPRPEPLPATWRKGWAPRRAPKRGGRSPALLRRAAAIARKQPWCDPKRVAECAGCACIRDARRELRRLGR